MPGFLDSVQDILTTLGGVSIVVAGLASWLGKRYLDRRLEQERLTNSRELESLRDRLLRSGQVYKAQFELEFKAYQEIWTAASALLDNIARFPTLIQKREVDDEHEAAPLQAIKREYVQEAEEGLQLLISTRLRYIPFISAHIVALAGEFVASSRGEIKEFWVTILSEEQRSDGYSPTEAVNETLDAFREVRSELDALGQAIRERMTAMVIIQS